MSDFTGSNLPQLAIEYRNPLELFADPRNPRKHSQEQLVKLRASIRELGYIAPIAIDKDSKIIAGHLRRQAAIDLGYTTVPVICVDHLDDDGKRALSIGDNRIAELASWDDQLLAGALGDLAKADFNLETIGFQTAEIDMILDTVAAVSSAVAAGPDDIVPPLDPASFVITRPGDIWHLGPHILLCGDALDPAAYDELLGNDRAQMGFTDPPYNVPINGHVSGLGKVQHREFAMASGEMSREDFTAFLTTASGYMAQYSIDGSIHYLCTDWRHIDEMSAATRASFAELKALCVWNKTNGGMGSLYRSKHELVFVCKNGTAPHINNVQLGRHGRYRTTVWDYAGANSFGATRQEDLADHPTVKPVALVADAIRDCSQRGGLILDPFAGSGTTILAADRTGRKAAAIEIDPRYVDVAVRRWQSRTGGTATLAGNSSSFASVESERRASAGDPPP